MLAARFDYFS